IIASGIGSLAFPQSSHLPMVAKYGEISQAQTTKNWSQNHLLLDKGYIIPDQNGQVLMGASFDYVSKGDWFKTTKSSGEHWQKNSQLWQDNPLYADIQRFKATASNAGIRATTLDHLPVCGPLINTEKFKTDYKDLHYGRKWKQYPQAEVLPNLFILSGLGSRGFTTAPLLAEYLSDLITACALPLEQQLCKIIHPNRFLYRQMTKGYE
ncbi:MAG: FAD-dependent oxidoreductase, partial [Proteobacteria bacterium]|nr:FAD-dependent oxidoreductase [Pseudomonadota bacterium]